MTDHARYREALLSDPARVDPALRAHCDSCASCAAFTAEVQAFETKLGRALRVGIPVRDNVLPFAARARAAPPRRFLALAASVLLGVLVAGGIWIALPGQILAAAVVAHMAEEPQAWKRTEVPVAEPALNAVLDNSKVRLSGEAGIVSYASSCQFRGRVVPHLVVQTDQGPVTVMILVHERTRRTMQFDEQGYRGTIMPVANHGSIAVLMKDAGVDKQQVQRVAGQVMRSIEWTP